jgi:uncharacterized membrane protein YhaH (DUF805 family)
MSIARWFFSFYGRIGRIRFLIGHGILLIIMFIIVNLVMKFMMPFPNMRFTMPSPDMQFKGQWLLTVLAPVLLISSCSLEVKRLHDIGISGWWSLAVFIVIMALNEVAKVLPHPSGTILGFLLLPLMLVFSLFLVLYPGKVGSNIYDLDIQDKQPNLAV